MSGSTFFLLYLCSFRLYRKSVYTNLSLLDTGSNRIDQFQRIPSELRKYLEWSLKIKREYGSFVDFVVKERLGWGGDGDLVPKGSKAFEHPGW